jgi:hypothetical protein
MLAVAASGCASGKRADVEFAMAAPPGPLQIEYEKRHSSDRGFEPCDTNEYDGSVTEITIEQTPCYGLCSTYTMTLRADGSVEYQGIANVEKLGTRRGRIPVEQFRFLARLSDEIGYFDLAKDYSCAVTDNPTIFTRVRRDQHVKLIRHYAPSMSGPARLRAFEKSVAAAYEWIEWAP